MLNNTSIGLVFSSIGAICLAISTFNPSKKHMLLWQVSDYVFTLIANLLLGGLTGALTIAVSIVRNTLAITKRDNRLTTLILVILQIVLGYYFNRLGYIGFLPIVASVSYTIAIQMTSSTQILRFVIIENMLLWFVYDVTIRAYPAAIMDIVITLLSAVSIWRFYQKKTS